MMGTLHQGTDGGRKGWGEVEDTKLSQPGDRLTREQVRDGCWGPSGQHPGWLVEAWKGPPFVEGDKGG